MNPEIVTELEILYKHITEREKKVKEKEIFLQQKEQELESLKIVLQEEVQAKCAKFEKEKYQEYAKRESDLRSSEEYWKRESKRLQQTLQQVIQRNRELREEQKRLTEDIANKDSKIIALKQKRMYGAKLCKTLDSSKEEEKVVVKESQTDEVCVDNENAIGGRKDDMGSLKAFIEYLIEIHLIITENTHILDDEIKDILEQTYFSQIDKLIENILPLMEISLENCDSDVKFSLLLLEFLFQMMAAFPERPEYLAPKIDSLICTLNNKASASVRFLLHFMLCLASDSGYEKLLSFLKLCDQNV
ncbi:hypothetical protein O9G_004431 [Rozella allomycis CSF55]|uniref:Uncharacterized protein n=1 Tax=Rozella allomycis (strain CSF55) TaxID=988480 RepID=A0A075AU41_ROZAC|nr:hypothetical protein O9G_004431 [Rozella allomycis CSF55]|eukprot:EPZ33783.1 hypothetical protein O9G_004431 [Rozella allomycis CSF55]